MRPQSLALVTLFALSVSAPASAQIVTQAGPFVTNAKVSPPITPDMVVARLMSFDRNADGRVVATELPERMQNLVARGDASQDGALDSLEVRRLAMAPATVPGLNGRQGPQYGFADSIGFDVSKQIEGALDDLRVGADIKQKALEIARKFLADANVNDLERLQTAMVPLLTREQLNDFRAATDRRTVEVPAIRRDGVTIFGATAEEAAGQERVMVTLRMHERNLESRVETYQLDADRKQRALLAIRNFKNHTPNLSDADRSALVEQLRGVLTDEQRDDLRAALGRRPVVQLASALPRMVAPVLPPAPAFPDARSFQIQKLLLTR
ncbi:MAG TPA: hypothetical protein VFV95_11370 [Vicinamibacterales bacterium]|nr:hypothetical protein [Vicinamibacterales bacterium]